MRTWLQDWLVVVAMVAAIVAYLVPLHWFEPGESIDTRAEDAPPRSWLGLAVGVPLGLLAAVAIDAWLLETMRSGFVASSTTAFLGAATLGIGLGGAVSGWCTAGTGAKWQGARIYNFHEPRRGRRVGMVRAAIGLTILALVGLVLS